jgi:hypothetical protein
MSTLALHSGNRYVANNVDNTVSEVSETATVPFSTLGGTSAEASSIMVA